jgi:hypothetical protein
MSVCVETNFICGEGKILLKKTVKKWRVNGGGVQKLESTREMTKEGHVAQVVHTYDIRMRTGGLFSFLFFLSNSCLKIA